ncbi:MAG: FkbM family methyltransferase [Deltaproteobacteria bacterium]|nr:FkbM family methyltransferase [Deltaproteobacteria bacterium]
MVKHLHKIVLSGSVLDDHFGVPFLYEPCHAEATLFFGNYEYPDWRLLRDCLHPGMTVVDVGANIGWYTALFAGAVRTGGHVFAIEPLPANFARLTRLIDLCPDDDLITAWCGALSDTSGTASLVSVHALMPPRA